MERRYDSLTRPFFSSNAEIVGAATRIVTDPARQILERLSDEGSTLDSMKRQVFRMFFLRSRKIRHARSRMRLA